VVFAGMVQFAKNKKEQEDGTDGHASGVVLWRHM